MKTAIKIVIAGSFVEVYFYERPVSYGALPEDKTDGIKEHKARTDDEALKRSAINSKKQVRLWIDANVWQWPDQFGKPCYPKFATFTFKKNITSLPAANYFFSKFIKRLNYTLGHKKSWIKYIVVREFQERGAVHYHALFFNLPFIDDLPLIIAATWQYGFVQVKAVDRVRNLAAYITKYMTKDMINPLWKGKRRYFVSKGLLKPLVIRSSSIAYSLLKTLRKYPSIAQANWTSEFAGKIDYLKIDLGRGNTINNIPLDESTKTILNALKQTP